MARSTPSSTRTEIDAPPSAAGPWAGLSPRSGVQVHEVPPDDTYLVRPENFSEGNTTTCSGGTAERGRKGGREGAGERVRYQADKRRCKWWLSQQTQALVDSYDHQ